MAPRFAVTLMIGRTVTAEIEARDAQAAEDIARFMVGYDPRFFQHRDEDIMDALVEDTGEGAAS